MESYYIEYLNAKDNFRATRIDFLFYMEAMQWGRDNLENFHIDMIKLA